mmetsp:Transcript_8752/g.11238  ORF Transcript_8752/g.11238 Transcript_8752/m.11238 type:complete len:646 (-) Transcript_8752:1116-3053(-)|eukprot:CAMPEP_0116053850 /NCGR_PEP_ID=MMETSP0322-20121206/2440_1 /TAXON_ID=163516 /ORGANISM="Leptocylindrus danicus var. apora, Strain B651" /LENGTH=645 /DNA_ID=CAMNT_0003537107 /DNA_START=117 /DNA_END=2054 /DNA_ORIENTATION=-
MIWRTALSMLLLLVTSGVHCFTVLGNRRTISTTHSCSELHMGLRKIFRRGRGRGVDEGDDDVRASSSSIPKIDYSSFMIPDDDDDGDDNGLMTVGDMPDVSELDEFDAELKRSNLFHSESINDRIRRVSNGQMTEDEKVKFIKSISDRDETLKKATRGPPIRQDLPLGRMTNPKDKIEKIEPVPEKEPKKKASLLESVLSKHATKGSESNSNSDSSQKSTPETTWSTVVARKGSSAGFGDGMDDSAKQAWFNMVTAPNRFSTFSTVEKSEKDSSSIKDSGNMKNSDDNLSAGSFEIDKNSEGKADWFINDNDNDESDSYNDQLTIPKSSTETEGSTLASRLEMAARLQAEREINMRKMQEAQKIKNLELQQQEKERLASIAREREEIFHKKQIEAAAKKKAEEEERFREQEELRRIADEKRRELEKQQDAYWKAKIEQERLNRDVRFRNKGKEVASEVEKIESERERVKREEEEEKRRQLKKLEEQAQEDKRKAAAHAKALMEASAQKILDEKKEEKEEIMKEALALKIAKETENENDENLKKALLNKKEKKIAGNTTNANKAKPIRQQVPQVEAPRKAPIRQKIPSDIETKSVPIRQKVPLQRVDTLKNKSERQSSATKKPVTFSDDERKKAQSFGINLDLLQD